MATHPRGSTTSASATEHVTENVAKQRLPKLPAMWHARVMRKSDAPRRHLSSFGNAFQDVTALYACFFA